MSKTYITPVEGASYKAGTELREVTLAEARAMECNRCGDCCNGLAPDVVKDEDTGLPTFVWGTEHLPPEDLYEERFGQRLLQPIGFLEEGNELPYQGEIGIVDKFEKDADGNPYTCFSCSMLVLRPEGEDGPETGCRLVMEFPNPDPKKLEQIRPRTCGEFPVFGLEVDAAILDKGYFIPQTGPLPRCTWHKLRVTGPWKQEPYWIDRFQRIEAGEEVEPIPVPDPEKIEAFIKGLNKRRKTIDGSRSKPNRTENGL